jgi:hypothetical protein
VKSEKTQTHYTYQVTRPKDFNELSPIWFVSLLTGPDNENDYTYLGLLDKGGTLRTTKKSCIANDALSFQVGRWIIQSIWNGVKLPDWVHLNHCGKCARCGRTLTTPESVESGFGPECIKKVGF